MNDRSWERGLCMVKWLATGTKHLIVQHAEHSKVVALVTKGAKKALPAFDSNPPDTLPEVVIASHLPLINMAIRKE